MKPNYYKLTVVLDIPVVAEFTGSVQDVELVKLQKQLWFSDAFKLLFPRQNTTV